jgi:hypothetical protein
VITSVSVDDPKVGIALVGHDISEIPDVYNPFAFRRDLRI